MRKNNLSPENIAALPEGDGFRVIYERQANLQEMYGRLALARSKDMQGKALLIMEEIFSVNKELGEMLDKLPWKHWKKYPRVLKESWDSEKVRSETLFEYVDGLHFFLNIGLILGFTPEEIFSYYIEKNKINHERQKRGY